MPYLASIPDYRLAARRRLPRFLFEYIDGGAFSEQTLARNELDMQTLSLRQRVLSGVGTVELATQFLGQNLSMPVILGPVGLAGLSARRGEVQAARAAQRAGVPFTLSTVGVCTLEEVARAVPGNLWFQLYVTRDRGFMRTMLARARAAGYRTLVFTVDMPVPGIRYRDRRSGLAGGSPWRRRLKRAGQALCRPRWSYDVGLRGRPLSLGHVASVLGGRAGVTEFWEWMGRNFDPTVSWRDIEEVRAAWDGPLILKGILDAEDARVAVQAGAQGVVVSNHGGRQLDGAPSSIQALPAIADAVGDRLALLLDGGVRSGADVVRALALGARAVLIARPWVWALGARGQAGVEQMLQLLREEITVAMALTGVARVDAVTPSVLAR
jgi:L-lactate dehydrogenase (cytochrome)